MWRAWLAGLAREEGGESLALVRILMGLAVIVTVGWVLFGGILPAVWVDRADGGIHALRGTPLVQLLGGAKLSVMWPLAWATLASGALLAVGLGGRLTAFSALQLTLAITRVNPRVDAAYDVLLSNGLWLCVLAPTTATLSLDARIRTGRWVSARPVGVWCRYLFVFQLVVMYTATGWQKLSAYWVPGGDFSALYYILQMPSFQYADMSWLARYFVLTQVGTAVSWFWEVTGPLLFLAVWASDPGGPRRLAWLSRLRVREVYAGIGLVMHVALFFLMEVGPFGFTSLAFYPALVHPTEWRALARRAWDWLPDGSPARSAGSTAASATGRDAPPSR